jgi:hypothetical protein
VRALVARAAARGCAACARRVPPCRLHTPAHTSTRQRTTLRHRHMPTCHGHRLGQAAAALSERGALLATLHWSMPRQLSRAEARLGRQLEVGVREGLSRMLAGGCGAVAGATELQRGPQPPFFLLRHHTHSSGGGGPAPPPAPGSLVEWV